MILGNDGNRVKLLGVLSSHNCGDCYVYFMISDNETMKFILNCKNQMFG